MEWDSTMKLCSHSWAPKLNSIDFLSLSLDLALSAFSTQRRCLKHVVCYWIKTRCIYKLQRGLHKKKELHNPIDLTLNLWILTHFALLCVKHEFLPCQVVLAQASVPYFFSVYHFHVNLWWYTSFHSTICFPFYVDSDT